jgi:hypothetical protein
MVKVFDIGEIKGKSLIIDLLKVLVNHGIISEYAIRNEIIKNEYRELREIGIRPTEARESLSEKYCIGLKSIEGIVYKKKDKN